MNTGIGLAGSGKPKVRPGDYERALALIVEVGGDKSTRAYLSELAAAEATHDKARTEAEAAAALAKRREATAREAEAAARDQREALRAETITTEARLSAQRSELATERQRLGEWGKELDAKDSDMTLREASLKRAFDAYNEGN